MFSLRPLPMPEALAGVGGQGAQLNQEKSWALRECATESVRRFQRWGAGQSGLRVKIKSLAEESRIIRMEEKKHDGQSSVRGYLRGHRIGTVREESRAAMLAYAFLRGRTYRGQEPKPKTPPPVARVKQIAKKFGDRIDDSAVDAWLAG